MLASFSVIPIGIGDELKEQIAQALLIVEESGLHYKLGSMQTTLEGEPDAVMDVIMKCHRRILELAPRVLTHITIDEHKGRSDRMEGKVRDVEEVLGRQLSHE